MARARIALLLATLALLAAACNPSTSNIDSSVAPTSIWDGDRPPDDVVFRIEDTCGPIGGLRGLVCPMPLAVVLGDGTVIHRGEFVGARPIGRSFVEYRLDAEGRQLVDELVQAVGFPEVDGTRDLQAYGSRFDFGNTRLAFRDPEGLEHVYEVYALLPSDDLDVGRGFWESSATRALIDLLILLKEGTGESDPYRERLQIFVGSSPGIRRAATVPWPLSLTPEEMADVGFDGNLCVVVSGDALTTTMRDLDGIPRLGVLETDEASYQFLIRDLVPGEEGCGPEYSEIS